MRTHGPVRNVHAVSKRLQPASERPARVLIAGGGAAGLETLIALRTLAGSRVELELISPERTFSWRSMAVAAAFGDGAAPRLDLAEMASTMDATYTSDSVVAGAASARPLCRPPAKIAGRYLGPYLSGSTTSPPTTDSSVVVVDVDFGSQTPPALAAGAGGR
jgi:hypothetical protein